MILPVQQARAAAQGRITLAFIPIGKSRTVKAQTRNKNVYRYESQPWAPQTARPEPLQARLDRRMPTVGHIVITAHAQGTMRWLLKATDDALRMARAAGFKTRAGLADHWLCNHDPDWPPTVEELCTRCAGEAVLPDGEECPACELGTVDVPVDLDDADVFDRFETHADTKVWVVHFHPVADDRPRFLSLASRPRGDDTGYTIGADPLDAGATVPHEFQVKISRKASERDEQLRRERGEGRDIASSAWLRRKRDDRAA
jgi:hypothetical protein